ncbi:MAG TPA: ATP-binding protein, partial [Coleofasciculaceae cyanobacterium]
YQNFYSLLAQLRQVERAQEWEVRLQPHQSKPFDAALTVTPVNDPIGRLVGLRWLLRDITERKRMEKQRRLLAREQAAREAAEAEGKRFAFLSEASRLLASCLNYRTTLARVARLSVPTLADWCFIDIVETNQTIGCETVIATSHRGKEAWVLQQRERYPLVFDGEYGVSKVLQTGEPELVADIPDSFLVHLAQDTNHLNLLCQFNAQGYMIVPLTARKRKLGTMTFVSTQPERRYRKSDLTMAVELAQRCAIAIDNGRLYQEAQDANRIKDEFLTIVSHELRTPLNAMLGWVTMLRKRTLNEATVAKALETIERNALSQKKLIEDILDVSRIIRGKLHLHIAPVHLIPIINAAIESVRPTAEIKAVQIEPIFDASVSPVMGDSERMQQIVWNLLTNAIKFTPTGGRVEIRLEQIDSTVQIVVKDTGKGITSEFLPHVFERFRQADATTTRSYGGLGLGLAIVRHLVEMHNGVVYATSEGEGRGAAFTVQLPILASHPEPLTENNDRLLQNVPSLDGVRVLVVDDNTDSLDLIRFILEQCQAQVTTAVSVAQALNAIAQLKPHILISDIGMPDEDGYSLIRQIRTLESEAEGQMPAIALTAFAREEERTLALNAGFSVHMPKPVEPADLVTVVAHLLGRSDFIEFN